MAESSGEWRRTFPTSKMHTGTTNSPQIVHIFRAGKAQFLRVTTQNSGSKAKRDPLKA
jgi:hypothetical protein